MRGMRSFRGASWIGLAAVIVLRLATASAGAAAETAARQDGQKMVRVGIELESPAWAVARYTPAMIAEADAIWRPYGVAVVVLLKAPDARDIADVRLTLAFGPASNAGTATAGPRRRGAPGLGAIGFDERGLPGRALSVDVAVITGEIREGGLPPRPLDQWPQALVDLIIGRALGRVLAHELGHYLLSSPAHAPSGLMKPSFDSRRLAGSDRRPFALNSTALPRLRARLARLNLVDQPVVSASEDLP